MKIAIIGTGNVGGVLATKWAKAEHTIFLGVKDKDSFKNKELLSNPHTSLHTVSEAVLNAEVVLLATPAKVAVEVAESLGDTSEKIIIDAMNIVMNQGPVGYANTTDAVLTHTNTKDVVKCFNTTGFNNMQNPMYGDTAIDMFVAGDSTKGKKIAIKLARDAGFAECYDIGGNDKFELMEQFARFWINLAVFQGLGREIGFKLLKR
jgi:hypothetical protein